MGRCRDPAERYFLLRADGSRLFVWPRSVRATTFMNAIFTVARLDRTVIQGLPRIVTLSRHMRPTMRVESVTALDSPLMKSLGVHGVIWDVDGTLMRRHGTSVAPHLADAFALLVAAPTLRHVVLSTATKVDSSSPHRSFRKSRSSGFITAKADWSFVAGSEMTIAGQLSEIYLAIIVRSASQVSRWSAPHSMRSGL